ncbi:MAG: VIT1/CCC1 transporter family protein [Thermomicrobiales bacterium]
MEKSGVRQMRDSLQAEIDGVAMYRALAAMEEEPALAQVYERMAETEARHAEYWRKQLTASGQTNLPTNPGWRTNVLIALGHRFGPQFILPTIVGREQVDSKKYLAHPEPAATGMSADESMHARLFRAISSPTGAGLRGPAVAQLEGRHRAGGGNALRAAVLGANDGLVSNMSLVMGVAGADLAGRSILITGLAGLLAGSLSMALGEWLSVQSARELYSHQIGIERKELQVHPEEEAQELALIYQAKGLSAEQATELGRKIVENEQTALDTLAREELGIDPEELGGSAWTAALTSFVLFSIGAIIPVIPYIITEGQRAAIASIVMSLIGLFILGAGITVITGMNAFRSGIRMVLFGLGAAAVTFVVGRLLNVSMSG